MSESEQRAKNQAAGESDHLRISRFPYTLVSFMKEKVFLKNFVSYRIYSLLKLCWHTAICRKIVLRVKFESNFPVKPGLAH